MKELLFKILGVPSKKEAEVEESTIEGEIETPLNTKRLHSLMNIDNEHGD